MVCRWAVLLSLLAGALQACRADDAFSGVPMTPALLGGAGLADDRILPLALPLASRAHISSIWDEPPIEPFRRQFFQGAEIRSGYLADTGNRLGGVDQTFEEVRLGFAVPLGSLDRILAVQPYFRIDHINGPEGFPLPETLYDTGVNFFQRQQWTETISTVLLVTPSVRSDWTTSRNAFRWFGLGLVQWQASRHWQWSIGAVYLDRADLSVLPAIGLSWTPRPWWKIDLTMPRPRIARRLWKEGGHAEGWLYAGASLGGNTWAITGAGGEPDEWTIGNIRAMIGYEKLVAGNRGLSIETGVAFRRTLETEITSLDLDLDDGVYLEAGWKF